MSDFDRLSEARKEVREFTRLHRTSILRFKAVDRDWFKVDPNDVDTSDVVRHLTTTASCVESLADSLAAGELETDPEKGQPTLGSIASGFAQNALALPKKSWESEGAAYIYCRVRALPAILEYGSQDVLHRRSRAIRDHLGLIWGSVSSEPGLQAIFERSRRPTQARPEQETGAYPPNAFHTFWALRVLRLAEARGICRSHESHFRYQSELALLWTQNMLAAQIALSEALSERRDPHQLAWSLAAQHILTSESPPLTPSLAVGEFARRDLYRVALDAFFEQQLPNGSWPLGQPIFHYPKAGNAYCYTYETLTELLRPALYTERGKLLRDLLRPHLDELMMAWSYARETALALSDDGSAVGWCSGHHPHRVFAEGWATAMTFSFLQCLRRLLGIWTREEAGRALGVRQPEYATPRDAVSALEIRGDTWAAQGQWSAGEQLAALFLHPVERHLTSPREGTLKNLPPDYEDPDLPLVGKNEARSAILFGLPGTGKTTLVEALAGSIGWRFVEIHASHFLSEGIDRVPGRADEIFLKLMELDHCVILFDEIDELLRDREKKSDPFGRFLTTSMLPKLARLWNQRRVLFFVATNGIETADPAIKRSQRFDAAIFVPPPSYRAKNTILSKELRISSLPFNLEKVEADLRAGGEAKDHPYGYFALLRWDQLDEYVGRVREHPEDLPLIENVLREIGPRCSGVSEYRSFLTERDLERRDHRRLRLVWVAGRDIVETEGLIPLGGSDEGTYVQLDSYEGRPPESIRLGSEEALPDGVLRYQVRSDG
jgi:hypothetical protein